MEDFLVKVIRAFSQEDKSQQVKVILFDDYSKEICQIRDDRATLFKLVDRLLEAGSKVVILDYSFARGGRLVEYRDDYANRLVIGRALYSRGGGIFQASIPDDLFRGVRFPEIPSGHLYLEGLSGSLPKITGVEHVKWGAEVKATSDVMPSLSLVGYMLGEHKQNSNELAQHILEVVSKEKQFSTFFSDAVWTSIHSGKVRLIYPELYRFFSPMSAADVIEDFDLMADDFKGNYVVIGKAYSSKEDFFANGENPSQDFIIRFLAKLGITPRFSQKAVPGVLIHATALTNLLDGDIYNNEDTLIYGFFCLLAFGLITYLACTVFSIAESNCCPLGELDRELCLLTLYLIGLVGVFVLYLSFLGGYYYLFRTVHDCTFATLTTFFFLTTWYFEALEEM